MKNLRAIGGIFGISAGVASMTNLKWVAAVLAGIAIVLVAWSAVRGRGKQDAQT